MLSLFAFLFLLPIQRAANRVNAAVAPEHMPNDRFSGWNWAGIVLGAVTWFFAAIGMIFHSAHLHH